MGIITYDQDTSHLHNEDGDFIGKIYREGDGLGPLIEERVNGWLSLSNERDQLRDHVRILRNALELVVKECTNTPSSDDDPHLSHSYDQGLMAETVLSVRSALEATKEGA